MLFWKTNKIHVRTLATILNSLLPELTHMHSAKINLYQQTTYYVHTNYKVRFSRWDLCFANPVKSQLI